MFKHWDDIKHHTFEKYYRYNSKGCKFEVYEYLFHTLDTYVLSKDDLDKTLKICIKHNLTNDIVSLIVSCGGYSDSYMEFVNIEVKEVSKDILLDFAIKQIQANNYYIDSVITNVYCRL